MVRDCRRQLQIRASGRRGRYSAGPSWYKQLDEEFDDSTKVVPQPNRLHVSGLVATGAADAGNGLRTEGGSDCSALVAFCRGSIKRTT